VRNAHKNRANVDAQKKPRRSTRKRANKAARKAAHDKNRLYLFFRRSERGQNRNFFRPLKDKPPHSVVDVYTDNDENKKILKDIQSKWIAYKEAKCAFYPQQGSIHRLDAADCYLQMTKERATELADIVGEFEGNQ